MRTGRGVPLWKHAVGVSCAFSLLSTAQAAQPAVPTELNQQNAQHQNAFTNAVGSDDSIDEATNNAMKAFMNLAALNIPGAISKGYQAYGNYLNSEKMDDLEARSKANRGSMTSIVNNIMSAGQSKGASGGEGNQSGVSGKVYSQMDTGFLYKGETAETAAEFEKKTGMKREDFFKHMAAGLDSHPTWDDPNLVQKLEAHFNNFKNAVPNKEFRDGLQAAQDSIPNFARNKIMGEIAGFYADATKGWNKATDKTMLAQSNVSAAGPADNRAPASADGAAAATPAGGGAVAGTGASQAPALPAAAEKIAASVASGKSMSAPSRDVDGVFIGLRTGDSAGAIKDFLSSPTSLASEQETLFKTVSKRYRLLTPALLGKASVMLNSK
jgi:hypothetical protein